MPGKPLRLTRHKRLVLAGGVMRIENTDFRCYSSTTKSRATRSRIQLFILTVILMALLSGCAIPVTPFYDESFPKDLKTKLIADTSQIEEADAAIGAMLKPGIEIERDFQIYGAGCFRAKQYCANWSLKMRNAKIAFSQTFPGMSKYLQSAAASRGVVNQLQLFSPLPSFVWLFTLGAGMNNRATTNALKLTLRFSRAL